MKSGITIKKGLLAFTILAIVSFVLLSGCASLSGGSGDRQTTPAASGESYGYVGSSGAPQAASSDKAYQSYAAPIAAPMPTGSPGQNAYTDTGNRKVIMTASIQIETGDRDKAVNGVRNITAGAGGYVESSSTWIVDNDRKQSTITVRVPSTQYEACLAQIKALGNVKSESSSGQDVTRQYVDLNASLANLKAEEKRLSEIMGMTKNVSEVLAVEKELSRVRGEIETTQAELNYLGSQVDFSTITVTVSEPQPVVGYDWGIDTAFRDAAHGFISMIGGLIVVTGYLIPLVLYFVIAAAILYLIVRVAWSFYKKRKAKEGKP